MTPDDYYKLAFKRNIGLVSEAEQQRLRKCRIAIAGLGGLGGRHLLDLVRMGIGGFNIADFDKFSIKNINRQVGATSKTVERPKVDVMAEMATDIHPALSVRKYGAGLQPDIAEEFVGDADIVVDAIDFFSMDTRTLLYRTAHKLRKPVVFAAPLGFSGTLHAFVPDGMSFEDYFNIHDDMPLFDRLINFAVGITPRGTHWGYMDMSKINASEHAGPSLSCACDIATGLLTSEVLIILLGRRPPLAAPWYIQFDPLRCLYRKGKLRWGNRGPLQRLRRYVAARKFASHKALLEEVAAH